MIHMDMKKAFTYLIGCITLSCTSCQQEELDMPIPSSEAYITFGAPSVALQTTTRTVADGFLDAFPTDGSASFGVLGYCLAYNPGTTTYNPNSGTGSWNLKRDECPPSVFYKKEVTIGTGGACTYDDPKRWYTDGTNEELGNITLSNTANYRYTFFAYYPFYNQYFDIAPAEGTAGAPVITFHMPYTGGTLDAKLENPAAIPDAMLAMEQNVVRGDRTVDFNFSHILTGLGFQLNNYSQVGETVEDEADKGVDLRIFSVKLRGTFYRSVTADMSEDVVSISYAPTDTYQGTYTLYEAEDQTNGTLIPWQQDGSNGSISLPLPTYLRLLSGNQTLGYFGPKSDDEENNPNPSLVIDYKLGDNERTTATIGRPGSFNPRSGVRYTAQINWVNNAFVLIMQADNGENWEDGEADDGDESNDDIIFQ